MRDTERISSEMDTAAEVTHSGLNDTEKITIGEIEPKLGAIVIDLVRVVLPNGAGIENLKSHTDGPLLAVVRAVLKKNEKWK